MARNQAEVDQMERAVVQPEEGPVVDLTGEGRRGGGGNGMKAP